MTVHVILSGGLDSTAALAAALSRAAASGGSSSAPSTVEAVSFDYGQRHRAELDSARAVAGHYGILHTTVTLPPAPIHPGRSSSLTDLTRAVPQGHYAQESMSATVVQGRNLLFAAATIARTQPGDQLWVGVHAGDHPIYPDCRPEFWDQLAELAAGAYGVTVVAPWLEMSKADVVREGAALGAPFELTWSCYEGKPPRHCGRCGTCVERAEAFALAGVPDPTDYADSSYWVTATASASAPEPARQQA